jgi:DNA-binding MarR family transcriptional regulator
MCVSKYCEIMTHDLPANLQPLDSIEEAAWRDLARFFVVAPRLLDEDLQRGTNLTLSAYSTLAHLSEAPDRVLRITELAGRAYLSGSRTTRLVDELATGGLVAKRRCPDDARGVEVVLTTQGLERLQRAYPVHLRSVRERVLDHISRSTLPTFADTMRAIAKALG